MNGLKRAFTLIELMLVMALIGLMGTISVGGYRAMRRGMEERGTMQNVNQFIRNAYQRALIDRQPTAIYFWNETRREESEDGETSILVVGRAVAVRRAGRVSYVNTAKSCLVDEFADLRFYAGTDEEGEEDDGEEAQNGATTFIYMMNGNESSFKRWAVSQATMRVDLPAMTPMMTDPQWADKNKGAKFEAFGYYLPDGVGDWGVGDAYGFEFAEISLPNNYIFGGESDYSKKISDPVKTLSKVLTFSPEGNGSVSSQKIALSAIRPGESGAPEAVSIGTTLSADSDLKNQNQ